MPSPVNLDRVELSVSPEAPDGFQTPNEDLGPLLGAEHLGGTLIELPPGGKAFPYHWEAAQEEWLIVLAGHPTVRTPNEREVLDRGDVVCFEAGPGGAHQVINETDEPCRLVMVSNRSPINVVVYPDSGKVGVRTEWMHPNFLEDQSVDYWTGE